MMKMATTVESVDMSLNTTVLSLKKLFIALATYDFSDILDIKEFVVSVDVDDIIDSIFVDATRGRQLLSTFGTFRNTKDFSNTQHGIGLNVLEPRMVINLKLFMMSIAQERLRMT